ncbi:methyltransferase [Desulfonatronum sp. SC1]|uniref:methyltransferase n=1 Tax=Desulfonatronum sp. SC1 TaxID=2109626 RepID=UPI000D30099B|nr:methyltransferase [Desulfonatronum sp. SC1]PTN35586.1 methyltransferase type 12 [Desulfonatronum sp. SC1]
MLPLPFVEQDYSDLYGLVAAPIRARLLTVGLELGVFDHLDEFRDLSELSAAIRSHPGNTELFLDALAAIGVVEKKEGRYRNTEQTMRFLMRRSPVYLGDLLLMITHRCADSLGDLPKLVLGGPQRDPVCDGSSEATWAEAARVSAAWVTGGVGQTMAAVLADLPEFPRFQKMLDLGGGHGMFALYFTAAHPSMTGVVFDRPAVVAAAEEFIREYAAQDRLSVQAGDYLHDDIGTGYDLVWACSTLNFARHDLDTLIGKVFAALNPGGVFASFQDGLTHERTRPDIMLGHLGEAMRLGRDVFFSQGEIAASMLRCGFRHVHSRTVETPMGPMDLDVARK